MGDLFHAGQADRNPPEIGCGHCAIPISQWVSHCIGWHAGKRAPIALPVRAVRLRVERKALRADATFAVSIALAESRSGRNRSAAGIAYESPTMGELKRSSSSGSLPRANGRRLWTLVEPQIIEFEPHARTRGTAELEQQRARILSVPRRDSTLLEIRKRHAHSLPLARH